MNSSIKAAERIEAMGLAIEGTRSAMSGAEPWTGSPVGEADGRRGGERDGDGREEGQGGKKIRLTLRRESALLLAR